MAAVFVTAACIHIIARVLTGLAARFTTLDRARTIGVLFGGTQKSLYVGVWIAAAWYPDLDAALVPILAYHIAQLVIDTGVASRYAYAILKGNLGGMTPMMRLSLVVVVLMVCVACAGSEENLRPGPYVGLAFVGGFSTFDNFSGVDEDLNDGVGAPGVQAMLGYQMWDRAAVELVYEGGMMFEGETDTEVDVNTLMAQGKLFLGVLPGEAFQIYVVGGFGYEWVKVSGDARFDDGGMAARAGLGLQYYLTENLPLFLEYSHTIAVGEDIEDFSYGGVKLGIMYRF